MDATDSKMCHERRITTPALPSDDTVSIHFPLLRLPLELRRMIYKQCVEEFRSPSPKDVHENNLPDVWKDIPSPLFRVNKQVRNEVFDILQKSTFTLRVTCHGVNFDALALNSFIAQERPRSYGDIPLLVEIWPPRTDRPIEMLSIWNHIRKLQDELRAVARIPKLVIWFRENEIATWCPTGEFTDCLRFTDERHPMWRDIPKILALFACVTNVTDAWIRLPPSAKRSQRWHMLKAYASGIIKLMERKDTVPGGCTEILFLTPDTERIVTVERFLKYCTAYMASNRLIVMTDNGQFKLSEAQWQDFVRVWPHFEALPDYVDGGEFKDRWCLRPLESPRPDHLGFRPYPANGFWNIFPAFAD